jgi:hypothetical protein
LLKHLLWLRRCEILFFFVAFTDELVTIQKMVMANTIQVYTICISFSSKKDSLPRLVRRVLLIPPFPIMAIFASLIVFG